MRGGALLRRARWGTPPAVLFGVVITTVIVALAAASLLLGRQLRHAQPTDARRDQATHAARLEAINLVTLDYRHIDTDVDNVLAGATGDFRDQYAKDKVKVKDVVIKNEVTSTGNVLESGVVTSDPDSVTVLVVVDSTVHNKASKDAQVRHYRMQLEMSRQGGRWLTSSLEFIS